MIRILPVILALILSLPGMAFSGRDHKRLSWNAIQNLHPAYRKLLKKHAEYIKHETPAPDFIKRKREISNHVWHPRGDWGNNVKKVVALTRELIRELRPLLRANKPIPRSTARKLAHLAHYVQDLCQPLHTSQSDKAERGYHLKFEKKWEDVDIKKVLTFTGKVRRIVNVEKWHKANGKWSNQFYDAIAADHGDDKRFNRKKTFRIYQLTFSRAHRATVEIWTTIFHHASLKKK